MSEQGKPPTQGVGVAGFKADVYASDEVVKNYCWEVLIHLPTFQMYAIEQTKGDVGTVIEWVKGFIQDQINSIGQATLFNNYSDWHSKKGYWKNEDVYGNLLEVEHVSS